MAAVPKVTEADLKTSSPEKTLWKGRRSFKSFMPNMVGLFFLACVFPWIFSLQAGVAGVAIFAAVLIPFWFLWGVLSRLQSRYFVSNKRVHARKGIIAKDTVDIELEHIRSIQTNQSVWGRLLSFGSITVGTEGNSGLEVTFTDIANPDWVKDTIDAYRVRL